MATGDGPQPTIPERKTSQEVMTDVATRWIAAFNDKNIENLLDLYDANAIHHSPRLLALHPETEGKIQGKEAMRSWWGDAFLRMPSLRYEKINFEITGDTVLITYKRTADGQPDSIVHETLKIQNGKIVESRVLAK